MNNLLEEHRHKTTKFWREGDTITAWDDICVWCIETFGLPGARWSYHPAAEYMIFAFKDSRDLVHFRLRW